MKKSEIEDIKHGCAPQFIPVSYIKFYIRALVKSLFMLNIYGLLNTITIIIRKIKGQHEVKNGLVFTDEKLKIESSIKFLILATSYEFYWNKIERFSLGKNGVIYIHMVAGLTSKSSKFLLGYDHRLNNVYKIKTKNLVEILNHWVERAKLQNTIA